MKISTSTLAILRNYATINTNILVRPGNTLSTISNAKNIFATATVAETFDREIAIYDLNSLLALLSLADDLDIQFGDKSLVINADGGHFEYFYAAANIVTAAPEKSITIDEHFTFNMTAGDVNMIIKAAAITGAPTLSIVSKGGKVVLSVADKKNDAANSYRKVVGEFEEEFDCHMAVENFKLIPDDYTVTLSKKKAIRFKNVAKALTYFLAMDPSSTI